MCGWYSSREFFPGFAGSPVDGVVVLDTASNLNLGGHVTAQGWVYFFLAVSVLSLVVAFFFARQVIGSQTGDAQDAEDRRSHQGRR